MNKKAVFLNFSKYFIYYLVQLYKYDVDIYYKSTNIWKYSTISFGFDYKMREKNADIIKYLNKNQVQYFFYSIDNIQTFNVFGGFDNIIFYDIMEYIWLSNKFEQTYNKFTYFLKFLSNLNALIHICVPDLIYEPDYHRIYTGDDIPNTRMQYRLLQYYCYLANTVQFFNSYFKYPIYRVVVPYLYQDRKIKVLNIDSLTTTSTESMKFAFANKLSNELERVIVPERCVMKYRDFASAFYLLFTNNIEPRNYSISSSNLSSTYWRTLATNLNKEKSLPIRVSFEYLKSLGFVWSK